MFMLIFRRAALDEPTVFFSIAAPVRTVSTFKSPGVVRLKAEAGLWACQLCLCWLREILEVGC